MIYFVNYFLLLFEWIIYKNSKYGKTKKIIIFISFLQLLLLLGFRGRNVGTDTKTYISYINSGIDNLRKFLEVGNIILIKTVSLFSNNTQMVLFIYAFLTLFFIFKTTNKLSKNVYFSLVIYVGFSYYYFAFNGMRQALAIAIAFYSITYMLRNEYLKSILLILIASSFHSSAIIFIIVLIVSKFKLRFNFDLSIIVIILVFLQFILKNPVIYLINYFFGDYSHYLYSDLYSGTGNITNPMLNLILFLFVSYFYIKNNKNFSRENDIYLLIFSMGVIIYFLSIQIPSLVRIVYYFSQFIIVILPNIIEECISNKERKSYIIIGVLLLSIYHYLLIRKGAHEIIPYYFFWR